MSYEHHCLDEPAVDCWNVTDGISSMKCARLIVREGDWTGYFETNGTYLLDFGIKTPYIFPAECTILSQKPLFTLPKFRIERKSKR